MDRVNADTVRQLAKAADIRADEAQLTDLAQALNVLLAAIERCDALSPSLGSGEALPHHEPAARFTLTGGATDAEL
jgi:Asp-tRNA(Asn)/Glu-tRNA(Gln) amidotransferase C subunit